MVKVIYLLLAFSASAQASVDRIDFSWRFKDRATRQTLILNKKRLVLTRNSNLFDVLTDGSLGIGVFEAKSTASTTEAFTAIKLASKKQHLMKQDFADLREMIGSPLFPHHRMELTVNGVALDLQSQEGKRALEITQEVLEENQWMPVDYLTPIIGKTLKDSRLAAVGSRANRVSQKKRTECLLDLQAKGTCQTTLGWLFSEKH